MTVPGAFAQPPVCHPSATIETLPPEVLITILSQLPYPSLVNLQHTSRFFHVLPPAQLLASARASYAARLFDRERRLATRREFILKLFNAFTHLAVYPNNIHRAKLTRAETLVCYTCFSELGRGKFAEAQVKKRRAFGHKDGHRRFCVACGVRSGKYVGGLRLRMSDGTEVVAGRHQGADGSGADGSCDPTVAPVEKGPEKPVGVIKVWEGSTLEGSETAESDQRRAGRCQRCWMIDHTTSPVAVDCRGGPPLCEGCRGKT